MKLSDLSALLTEQGFTNQIDGDYGIEIKSANTLDEAGPNEISFLANPKYRDKLSETRASAVIVSLDDKVPADLTVVRTADPYGALTAAVILIHGYRQHPQWGIDPRSSIALSAQIGDNANIGPFVTISDGVVIGDNATIYPGCYIGNDAQIGNDVTLFPNVIIYDDTRLGDRVALHANTVIGEDGLGYAPVDGQWMKIPQVGRAVIGDDVEMGAGCSVNSATLGTTHVGNGSKFSDQVVLGHGVKIGERCMFVAQVGIAGSADIGDDVTLGGQVGINGHIRLGNGALVGGKSSVWFDVGEGEHHIGIPAVKANEYRRQAVLVKRLPEIRRSVRRMEVEIEALQKKLAEIERR